MLANSLVDYFEVLAGAYEAAPADADGIPFGLALKREWGLFESLADAEVRRVLTEILQDEAAAGRVVVDVSSQGAVSLTAWEGFKNEVLSRNRYFPEASLDLDRIRSLLEYVIVDPGEETPSWYRARVLQSDRLYSIEEMGAPPPSLTPHGRANPAGIPYFYLASSPEAAIAETRPHPGERVCVAEFSLPKAMKVVDLLSPRERVSPFMILEEELIRSLRAELQFLECLGAELALPVIPREAAVKYVPSQYLCELIKRAGYHGVLYRSSLAGGANLALFSEDHATPTRAEVACHKVDGVMVKASRE